MTVLGIMKNLFKKKFRVYRDDLQKLMQSISIEKVKDVLKNGPRELKESVQKSLEKTSEKNWYYKAAKSCEKVNDAVLREDKGFTRRATKAFAGKVGAAGASAGIFAMASMFGSAGNISKDRRRRGYSVRYTGNDVFYCTGKGSHLDLRNPELEDGDRLDSKQYPVVWEKGKNVF